MTIGRYSDIDGRSPLSISTDQGRSWVYQPSQFSPVSFAQLPVMIRLAEGPLIAVHYTDSSDKRGKENGMEIRDAEETPRRVYGTFASLSFDDGATWTHHKLLPSSAENPYPFAITGYFSVVQTPDGLIHLVSSRLYYRFNLAWLKTPMPPQSGKLGGIC